MSALNTGRSEDPREAACHVTGTDAGCTDKTRGAAETVGEGTPARSERATAPMRQMIPPSCGASSAYAACPCDLHGGALRAIMRVDGGDKRTPCIVRAADARRLVYPGLVDCPDKVSGMKTSICPDRHKQTLSKKGGGSWHTTGPRVYSISVGATCISA